MCVSSDGSPSRPSSLGAMKRLIACHTVIGVNTVVLKQINKHDIVVLRLSYADIITRLSRPKVAMYAGSDGSPSCRSSLGALKMLVAPQSIRARLHCFSPCTSRTYSSWTVSDTVGGRRVSITIVLVNALHSAQCIAAISSFQLTERFSSWGGFSESALCSCTRSRR